ncbi:3-alpha-(or 20-beta)-hydroxysteroid dehydrogenase [BD1-7 clade bacterium]|uniref:3-alpha-(Or 20-beta)-hydroxysteroid dehydrogenase n=1 Tax=BD1-7 clade bacterium TaxID=2029982 RepID=A0A5S9N7Y3_9GAMM|nr:3-alpha-(or 20-beta)-hydroxysteroid dehydrogenase [BD1-7 clade bacterium]CAA0085089.1 3-alpha-(or 20-beta)-hydroxysteroid dehydrogenase [BD1-7 clade bacterium]
MSELRLSGKTAIITGAAQGMGAVTAKLFVENGANVVIADILEDKGQALADELGDAAAFVKLDVTNEANWQDAVAAAEKLGPLNVLVNNAGILAFKSIAEQTAEEYTHILNINLVGCYNGIRAAIEPMKRAGCGSIINISSIDGLQAKNSLSAYASSKWGMRGLTKAAANELGHHKIRVNTVHPGGINTEMGMGGDENMQEEELNTFYKNHAIPRTGYAIEVARMSLFLATDEASYSTGSEFLVDGGWNAGLGLDFLPKS